MATKKKQTKKKQTKKKQTKKKQTKKKTTKTKRPAKKILPPPKWGSGNLYFDKAGRLVITEPKLQEWFINLTEKVFGEPQVQVGKTKGGGFFTHGPGMRPSAVKTCDVIVVGSCGLKPPVPDTKCDILIVKRCGSGTPSVDTRCLEMVKGKAKIPKMMKSCQTGKLEVIIRNNEEGPSMQKPTKPKTAKKPAKRNS